MKRTRAQQPKAEQGEPQDPTAAATTTTKPQQRRAKQPRQPKAGGKTTKPGGAAQRAPAAASAAPAAAATANAATSAPSPGPETAATTTVPDVLCVGGGGHGDADAAGARSVDCCWDLDAGGLNAAGAAWWTWGVEEEKLLGWFPFVEEDFPACVAGRAGEAEAEVAAFDHDIWSIW